MPGYSGVVARAKHGGVGLTYAAATKQCLAGNIHFGPKDRELDLANPEARFISVNEMDFPHEGRGQLRDLQKFKRPASAGV
jgi:hypothetical protein